MGGGGFGACFDLRMPPPPEALGSRAEEAEGPAGAVDASSESGGRTSGSAVFADLTPLRRYPAYRRLWFGQTVSTVGQQMTSLAVAVQVFALTGSSFAVGLVGLFVMAPVVAFGLLGGAIADSMDRRRLGLVASSGMVGLVVILAVLAVLRVDQVWPLYAVVALHAACWAVNSPAHAAIVPRVLPTEALPAANALSSLSLTLGLTLGPLLGGLVVAVGGVQAAYLIDAVAFSVALYALWRLPEMPPSGGAKGDGHARQRASVREGLRFLQSRPNVRATFLAHLSSMVLGMPRALFPAVAAAWYGGGSATIGMLTAAIAVGAFTGALFSGWLGRVRRQGRAVLLAVVAWGSAITAFGLTASLWLGMLLLAVAGFADTVSSVCRTTIVQVTTPDEMRGRLSGVLVVVGAGGPRLGDLRCGSVATLTTERAAIVGGGLACIVAALALAARWPGFWNYDADDPHA